MSTLKYNTWLNTDNTENYKCRAWVNFNGTGTVAIRASGNVSSITDNGTGDYTVNFATVMSDANYSVCGTTRYPAANNNFALSIGNVNGTGTYSTSAVQVNPTTGTSSSRYDCDIVNVQIFR
jgi:hypothetical protein